MYGTVRSTCSTLWAKMYHTVRSTCTTLFANRKCVSAAVQRCRRKNGELAPETFYTVTVCTHPMRELVYSPRGETKRSSIYTPG